MTHKAWIEVEIKHVIADTGADDIAYVMPNQADFLPLQGMAVKLEDLRTYDPDTRELVLWTPPRS